MFKRSYKPFEEERLWKMKLSVMQALCSYKAHRQSLKQRLAHHLSDKDQMRLEAAFSALQQHKDERQRKKE